MDTERWAKIDHLLDQVMERPPETREAFLAAACAGDDELTFNFRSANQERS